MSIQFYHMWSQNCYLTLRVLSVGLASESLSKSEDTVAQVKGLIILNKLTFIQLKLH